MKKFLIWAGVFAVALAVWHTANYKTTSHDQCFIIFSCEGLSDTIGAYAIILGLVGLCAAKEEFESDLAS
jgi:hypothetical protein